MTAVSRTARVAQWFRTVPAVLLLAPFLLLVPGLDHGQGKTAEEHSPKNDTREAGPPVNVQVRFTDDSVLKLTLRDRGICMNTRYGKMLVPVADIRYIDFATRIPRAITRRIEAAVTNLGNRKYAVRQAAGAELLELREKAYPALLLATRNKDLEVARRAEELVKQLREQVPSDQLTFRKYDVLQTIDSRITGRLQEEAIRATTFQFGEVRLQPGHMRSLQFTGIDHDPSHVETMRDLIGKSFQFKVTGALDGPLFGSGVYTSHSALATAAVHASILKPGQAGVIRVTFVVPPAAFGATQANGVTSAPHGTSEGAYVLSR
jgi:hypothetical protein